VIPRDANADDLAISHQAYDRTDALRDINLVFPLERLRELEAEGVIGRVTDEHFGFGLSQDPKSLLGSGTDVGRRPAKANVDLAVLVPG
jgi:D-proline reductase (dithiol) PrdB